MPLNRVACPTNLALCRIAFFGWLLLSVADRSFSIWGIIPAELARPFSLAGLVKVPVARTELLEALGILWKLSLVCGLLGVGRRTVFGIAALLGLYLLSLPAAFGKLGHNVGLPMTFLFIFWLARSTDRYSIDAWLRRRRGLPEPEASVEYHWPIVLGRALLALAFCAAGFAKIRHNGLDWITSDNFQTLLVRHHYTHTPPVDWGLALATSAPLCHLMAGMTVFIELFYPLALVVRRARWPLVGGAILMQVGIWLLLGVDFRLFMAANVMWIDWDAVRRAGASLRERFGRRVAES